MWQCPKCNREFKNTNQDHYCGKIETIDKYIADQPAEVQLILCKIRKTIDNAAPNATEKISWRIPTFWQGENLVHFATFKKHIGLYPGGKAAGALVNVGTIEAAEADLLIPLCDEYTQELYRQAKTGNYGKSLAFDVTSESILRDMKELIALRVRSHK
jgi:hypothetical protein